MGIGQGRSPASLEKGEEVICMIPSSLAANKYLIRTLIDNEANGSDQSTEGEFTWTEEEETRVRRKLDRVIVPLTTLLYLMCFLDR